MVFDGSISDVGVSKREYLKLVGGFASGWWNAEPDSAPRASADRAAAVADYVVTTTEGLRRAFERLGRGDTVYVATGVYRIDDWLTIDASDVTVVGESRRRTLIKPADGANVGGIRVGPDGRVENVLIRGIGFHGNAGAMDQSADRLHGFIVENARYVTIRECYATRTSPYHLHDAGGSGITVRRRARDVAVLDNYTRDVGDRSIQVAGERIVVAGNRLTDGWDRAICLEVRHPDGRKYFSRDVSVVNNVGEDHTDGNIVGASQIGRYATDAGNYAIVGNVGVGSHRHLVNVAVRESTQNVLVAGNVGILRESEGRWSGIRVDGELSGVSIVGNDLADYSVHGIELVGGVRDFACAGNVVRNPRDDGIHAETRNGTIDGNVVRSPGGAGVDVAAGGTVVSNNVVVEADGGGVRVGPSATPAVVAANLVRGFGRNAPEAAGIEVAASGALVSANRVEDAGASGGTDEDGGVGVRETDAADRNLYVGNLLPDGDVWRLSGSGSRAVGNLPSPSAPRELQPHGGTATVEFDRPRDRKPALDVQTESPSLWGVEWHRDGDDYVGATITFERRDGSPANPVTRVSVRDR